MATAKERTTINFDADVYQKVLSLRANPQYARMSVSAIVNMLLGLALNSDPSNHENSIQHERRHYHDPEGT